MRYFFVKFLAESHYIRLDRFFRFDYFQGDNGDKLRKNIREEVTKKFAKFRTLGDFKKSLRNSYIENL